MKIIVSIVNQIKITKNLSDSQFDSVTTYLLLNET